MKINKKLASQIKEMFDVDQSLRRQGIANKNLIQPLINLCSSDKDKKSKIKPSLGLANFMIYMLDIVHNYRISKIIKEYGYPTKTAIGEKSMFHFFLLIQHQDYDLELQKNCLKHCDFELKEKAYLTDRILVNSDKKQEFGTQFYTNKKTGVFGPRPIKDIKHLDERRKKYNLPPFEEYKKLVVSMRAKGLKAKNK